MTVERRFDPVPASVPSVRHFVLACVEHLPQHQLDVVALLVSELATNAVVYGATAYSVSVWCGADGVVVTVTDDGAGEPAVQPVPEPTNPRGRGLIIVSQLADEWGIDPSFTGVGKTVWFRLRLGETSEEASVGRSPLERSRDSALVL